MLLDLIHPFELIIILLFDESRRYSAFYDPRGERHVNATDGILKKREVFSMTNNSDILNNAHELLNENVSSSVRSSLPAKESLKTLDPINKYSALLVRGTIIGSGLLGISLFLRHSRFFVRFQKASHIPDNIIRNQTQLNGRIKKILPNGIIKVEHEPFVNIPSLLSSLSKSQNKECNELNVRLSGINLSQLGIDYLQKDLNLTNKQILFTVIKPIHSDVDIIDADVILKNNRIFRSNLNLELIRKGYARVLDGGDAEHIDAIKAYPSYSRLVSRLLVSEQIADRRGLGIWQRETWVESIAAYPSQLYQIIRNNALTRFMILLGLIGSDVAKSVYHLAKRGYHASTLMLSYFVHLYRLFDTYLHKISSFYLNAKRKLSK